MQGVAAAKTAGEASSACWNGREWLPLDAAVAEPCMLHFKYVLDHDYVVESHDEKSHVVQDSCMIT